MRKKTVAIISLGTFAALCWTLIVILCACFVGYRAFKWAVTSAYQIVFVERPNLESEPGIRILDANNPFFKVTRKGPKRLDIEWAHINIKLKHPKCRAKRLNGMRVRVMGQLNGDKEYPVVIDTGNPKGLVVSDTVVADSQLDIYPMEMRPNIAGLCHVAQIEIGDMAITNPLCHYKLSHYERKVFGQIVWKERLVTLGLELMRKFAYLLIDNIAAEVEFCAKDSFQPDANESWSQYPMSIEKDEWNQERLMIDIPIGGETRQAVFDTGSDGGLDMTEGVWQQFRSNLTVQKRRESYLATPRGLVACSRITVKRLAVGDRLINNATINVVSNDTPFQRQNLTLGMRYFQDTGIVLDFQRMLMWVKYPKNE
jgi:hypothetical protein